MRVVGGPLQAEEPLIPLRQPCRLGGRFAALGLSVSAAMLQGCTIVVVEGPSDQLYMTAIKTVLIARRMVAPKREILFVPAGGAKGVNAVVPIVAAKDGELPVVILDDDRQGRQFAEALRAGPLYRASPGRVINIREFVNLNFEYAEIEDLVPAELLSDVASRIVRGANDDFSVKVGGPIVSQIEAYAAMNSTVFPVERLTLPGTGNPLWFG